MERDELNFFSRWEEVEETKNRLPHWQQHGALYFVIWRLADSIPETVLAQHFEDRRAWLKRHPEPWDEETEKQFHACFSSELDRWMDRGQGQCLLRKVENARILAQTLQHFEGQRSLMISFVAMPNHVHVLFALKHQEELGKTIQSWKRQSAREINRRENRSGALWQKDYFDRLIRNGTHFENCVRYIRNNPRKARVEEGQYLLFESNLAKSID
ncbi:MAG: transposase [Verrucomicrobiota bacterium]